MTGVAKNTVVKLLEDLGCACADFHDRTVRNLRSRRIQTDEIWSLVYAKEKNVPIEKRGQYGVGDVWTWTAIDADSKVILSWMVGGRSAGYAKAFMDDVAGRLAHRVQLTTDGHATYLEATEHAFGGDLNYAMLVKLYGAERPGEARYSPAKCVGCRKQKVVGDPDPDHISTSYVERQNLTMRMSIRQFTRLTNAFSKKVENHAHSVAIHFVYYNLVRRHQTLRCSPAMAAGLPDHLWSIEELVGLVEEQKAVAVRASRQGQAN